MASVLAGLGIAIAKRKFLDRYRVSSRGPTIMSCQSESNLPALTTLARSFVVCDRWFCSVPGETWPNRLFAHAGTSDGTVSNEIRFYNNRTIFDLLDEHGIPWGVYHDGMPQVFCFPTVLFGTDKHRPLESFTDDCRTGNLKSYSFLEPNHGIAGSPQTNSQHPGNNAVEGEVPVPARAGADFRAADALIATVYEGLRNGKDDLFAKTLLVITYDEHGGFYDREPPPTTAVPPYSGARSSEGHDFDFTILGARVPAVVVSPRVPSCIDRTERDHTTITRTVRDAFDIDQPLSDREAIAPSLLDLVQETVRIDLPDLSALCVPRGAAREAAAAVEESRTYVEMNGLQRSLVELADAVMTAKQRTRELAPDDAAAIPVWPNDDDRRRLTELSGPELREFVATALQ